MRKPGLDLLRAIAIVWVMLFHSFVVGGLGESYGWLSRFGWMGVDLFFVLSGFLIGSQVLTPLARGERLSFRDFYLRRAFRILPAFAAVLVLYLACPWFREAPGLEPWWKFASFTLNLSIDYANRQAFSHAWSLCVEEHFYLLFPLLALWMTRRPSPTKFVAVCLFVVLAGIALRGGVWLHDTAVDPQRPWFVEDIYYPTWNRLDGLLAGVVLATIKAFRPQLWERMGTRANTALMLGLAIVALSFWLFRDRVGLLGNTLGWPVLSLGLALLVFAGAQPRSWISRWRVPGRCLAGRHFLQPLPGAQGDLPDGGERFRRAAGRARSHRVRGLCDRGAARRGVAVLRRGAAWPGAPRSLAGLSAPAKHAVAGP